MTRIKQIGYKLSETKFYLYLAGLIIMLSDVIKTIFKHITECLIVLVFSGMLVVAQAFDSDVINFITTAALILILIMIFIILFKIKIIKSR